MEISMLKIFLTVVNEGSISKAAEVLNYAQSNVTMRIKQLERDFGKPLLYRHSRGIKPTLAGQLLYDYADKILKLCEDATKAIKNSETTTGIIKIGAIEEIATLKLPKFLASYSKYYLDIDFDITISTTEKLIRLVVEHEIDGAYVVGPVKNSNLKQQFIMVDQLVLISSQLDGSNIDLKCIENKRILLTNANCLYKERVIKWFEEEGTNLGNVMEFSSLEGLLTCVKEGLGVTVMAKSLFEDLEIKNEVSWVLLPDKFGKVEIMFITRQDYDIASLQKFLEIDIT